MLIDEKWERINKWVEGKKDVKKENEVEKLKGIETMVAIDAMILAGKYKGQSKTKMCCGCGARVHNCGCEWSRAYFSFLVRQVNLV